MGGTETGLTRIRALNAENCTPDTEWSAPVRRTLKLRFWATDGRGVVKPTSDVADRSSIDTVVFPFTVNCGRIGIRSTSGNESKLDEVAERPVVPGRHAELGDAVAEHVLEPRTGRRTGCSYRR